MAEEQEKILYQFTMNYKAYRRKLLATNITITLIIAGGLAALCVVSVLLGILLAAMAITCGAISILVCYGAEETYTVYNTKVVIKKRSNDYRTMIGIDTISFVGYKRAFYEKDLATGTVTFVGRNAKDKKKKFRLKHVFNAEAAVEYLKNRVSEKNVDAA